MNPSLRLLLAIGDVADRHLQEVNVHATPRIHRFIKTSIAIASAIIVLILAASLFIYQKPDVSSPGKNFLSAQRPAPQTLSLAELIARSDCIILGDIVAEHRVDSLTPQTPFISSDPLRSVPNIDYAYEHTVTVAITDVLKGDVAVGDQLDISNNAHDAYDKNGRFLGTVYLGDAALMKSGDHVLLFLERPLTDDNSYRLIGEGAKWFLKNDNVYYCGVCFDTRFPDTFTPYIGLTDYTPLSLEQLTSIIQKLE